MNRCSSENGKRKNVRQDEQVTDLHQICGSTHNDGHGSGSGQSGNDASAICSSPCSEQEDADLSVRGEQAPVGQAHAVRIAEGEDGCQDVGDEDIVCLHARPQRWHDADGQSSHNHIASNGDPERQQQSSFSSQLVRRGDMASLDLHAGLQSWQPPPCSQSGELISLTRILVNNSNHDRQKSCLGEVTQQVSRQVCHSRTK